MEREFKIGSTVTLFDHISVQNIKVIHIDQGTLPYLQ